MDLIISHVEISVPSRGPLDFTFLQGGEQSMVKQHNTEFQLNLAYSYSIHHKSIYIYIYGERERESST